MGNLESCYVGDCNITNICSGSELISLNETHCQSVSNESVLGLLSAGSCHVVDTHSCMDLLVHKEKPATKEELNYDEEGER